MKLASSFLASISIFALTITLGPPAKAEEPSFNGSYTIRPATSPINVDSVLDEQAWQDALLIPLASEWAPGNNAEPPVRTECLVTFDDNNLYVAFRAYDPDPAQIRARLADRDVPFSDDTVGFLLDTFNDQREAYEFRVNSLGIQMDGTLSDIGEADQSIDFWSRIDYDGTQNWSWDAIWDSAGKITAEGFVVEIAIPFRQLRVSAGSGPQTWGFLATRFYPRNYEYQFRSSRRDFDRNCQVCQFDTLDGLSDLPQGKNLEINPTITAQSTERFLGAGSTEDETDLGLSLRWGITPGVSLNATLNPDFSQVEADLAQLDVNERFALFFPEKRPFFLDGAEIFASPIRAVYTRTIADPKSGIKLTGRKGRNSFGALFAEDRINNVFLPAFERSTARTLDQEVQSGVLRFRRDFGKTSNIGFLYTGRDADGYENHVFGVDGRLQAGESGIFRFQYLRSDTQYPDDFAQANRQPLGSFTGDALELRYDYETRDWLAVGRLRLFDKNFRADSGFVVQVDNTEFTGVAVRSFWGKPDDWYTRLAVQFDYVVRDTEAGERFDEGANLTFIYEGAKQTIVQFALRPNWETFLGEEFNNFRYDLFFSTRPTRSVEVEGLFRNGEIIDFLNVRRADFFSGQLDFKFKLGRGFTVDLSHQLREFSIDEGTFLIANLSQTTLIYHFNHRAFLRAIVQYEDTERIPNLHNFPVEPNRRTLLTQGLFSYKLNAKTVLFLGYADNYLGTGDLDIDQTNRTFFLKVGYAWLR